MHTLLHFYLLHFIYFIYYILSITFYLLHFIYIYLHLSTFIYIYLHLSTFYYILSITSITFITLLHPITFLMFWPFAFAFARSSISSHLSNGLARTLLFGKGSAEAPSTISKWKYSFLTAIFLIGMSTLVESSVTRNIFWDNFAAMIGKNI